ncbi:MAG: DMT family transporter [Bryobacteraceae bacterium]
MILKRYLNLAILVLVNFLWAAQYPAYKIASDHMSPATLNFWTLFCSALLLMPFLLLSARRSKEPRPRIDARAAWDFILLGIFGILPPSLLLSWGISRSTASNAAIVQLTVPVLMVLMAMVLLGERATPLRIASLVIALGGTVLTSRSDLSGDIVNTRMLVGNIVVFLSGFGSAFYNTYSKRVLSRFGELRVLLYTYIVACAGCALISLFDGSPFFRLHGYPQSVWLSIGVLGAFTWGIAMVLWMWVLNRLEAIQVSVSIYMLSIFGVVLSAVTLGERLHFPQIAGGLMVFVATFLTSEYEARRKSGTAGC